MAVGAGSGVAVATVGGGATRSCNGVPATMAPSAAIDCTITPYPPGPPSGAVTVQVPWALTVVVATSVSATNTCNCVAGSPRPVRVTVVVTSRVKLNSLTLGAGRVGVAEGIGVGGGAGVAVGATVSVSVAVGKASTSAFIGTVTSTARPSLRRAVTPISYWVGFSRGVTNDHKPSSATVAVLITVAFANNWATTPGAPVPSMRTTLGCSAKSKTSDATESGGGVGIGVGVKVKVGMGVAVGIGVGVGVGTAMAIVSGCASISTAPLASKAWATKV